MKPEYSYSFIKNINESIYDRFDDFIRICLVSKDNNYIFISASSSLFELAFKQFLFSKDVLFEFFKYKDPNLYDIISGDSLEYLKQYFDINFNIIHKYRIESNSSKHDIFPIIPTSDRKEILRNLFCTYVLLNNLTTNQIVQLPSDDYIALLSESSKDVIDELNKTTTKLNDLNSEIKAKEQALDDFSTTIKSKENEFNKLENQVTNLEKEIQTKELDIQIEKSSSSSSLKKIAYEKLNDGEYIRAQILFEKAAKLNPIDFECYIGYFLAVNNCKKIDEMLNNVFFDIKNCEMYNLANIYLDNDEKNKINNLADCVHKQYLYQNGIELQTEQSFQSALSFFEEIKGFKNVDKHIIECKKGIIYLDAKENFFSSKFDEALEEFNKIIPFLDSDYFKILCLEALNKLSKKETILEKKRIAMKADRLFSNFLFDEAIVLYKQINDEKNVVNVQKFKRIYDLYIKFINFDEGGDELFDVDKESEEFIEIGRRFPGCFEEREKTQFSTYVNIYQCKKLIDLKNELLTIEKSINIHEQKVVASALFFAVFSKPYIELRKQIETVIQDKVLGVKYIDVLKEEARKANYLFKFDGKN